MRKRNDIPPAHARRLRKAKAQLDAAPVELRAAVVAAHEAGGSVRAIADEIGMGTTAVMRWINAAKAAAEHAERGEA